MFKYFNYINHGSRFNEIIYEVKSFENWRDPTIFNEWKGGGDKYKIS